MSWMECLSLTMISCFSIITQTLTIVLTSILLKATVTNSHVEGLLVLYTFVGNMIVIVSAVRNLRIIQNMRTARV